MDDKEDGGREDVETGGCRKVEEIVEFHGVWVANTGKLLGGSRKEKEAVGGKTVKGERKTKGEDRGQELRKGHTIVALGIDGVGWEIRTQTRENSI